MLIFILTNIKIIHFVFCMESDEIQFLCYSNPEAIVDHIESLEIESNEVKIESNLLGFSPNNMGNSINL